VGGFVEGMARQENKSKKEMDTELFKNVRPSSLLKRFATVDEVAAIAQQIEESYCFPAELSCCVSP
jgi:hypothetical protein